MIEKKLKGFVSQYNNDAPILEIEINELGYIPTTSFNTEFEYAINLENTPYNRIFIPNGHQKLSTDYEYIFRAEDDNLITIAPRSLSESNPNGTMRRVPFELVIFEENTEYTSTELSKIYHALSVLEGGATKELTNIADALRVFVGAPRPRPRP